MIVRGGGGGLGVKCQFMQMKLGLEREATWAPMFSHRLATKQVPRATEGLMNSAVFRRVLTDASGRVQW